MHVCIRTAVKPIKKSVKIIEFNTVSITELRQIKSGEHSERGTSMFVQAAIIWMGIF